MVCEPFEAVLDGFFVEVRTEFAHVSRLVSRHGTSTPPEVIFPNNFIAADDTKTAHHRRMSMSMNVYAVGSRRVRLLVRNSSWAESLCERLCESCAAFVRRYLRERSAVATHPRARSQTLLAERLLRSRIRASGFSCH